MTADLVTREAEKRLRAAEGGGERSTRPGAAPPAEALPIAADVFRAIAAHVAAHPEVVGKAKTSFQFRLSDPVSVWTVDLRNDAGRIAEGEVGKPDVTLALTEADFIGLYTGSANAMKLFTTGKLKITGDIAASQRLQVLAGMTPDLVARETRRRVQGAVVSTAKGGTATPAAEPKPAKAAEILHEVGEAPRGESDALRRKSSHVPIHGHGARRCLARRPRELPSDGDEEQAAASKHGPDSER